MVFTDKQEYVAAVQTRQAFQTTFGTPEGKGVLAALLNRLGFFANDPQAIKPELIAVANWILSTLGCVTVDNLGNYIEHIVTSASNQDLVFIDPDAPAKRTGGEV